MTMEVNSALHVFSVLGKEIVGSSLTFVSEPPKASSAPLEYTVAALASVLLTRAPVVYLFC